MQTKLTLRLDESLIEAAKVEAARRGTSLSRLVADLFRSLSAAGERRASSSVVREEASSAEARALSPRTQALLGVLREEDVDLDVYRNHLQEKYLR